MDSKSPERYISQALTVSKPCFAPGSRRHSSLNFCSLAATSWPGDRAKGHLSDGTDKGIYYMMSISPDQMMCVSIYIYICIYLNMYHNINVLLCSKWFTVYPNTLTSSCLDFDHPNRGGD